MLESGSYRWTVRECGAAAALHTYEAMHASEMIESCLDAGRRHMGRNAGHKKFGGLLLLLLLRGRLRSILPCSIRLSYLTLTRLRCQSQECWKWRMDVRLISMSCHFTTRVGSKRSLGRPHASEPQGPGLCSCQCMLGVAFAFKYD